MCSFYENLYSSNHINDENISSYLQDVTCPELNDQKKKRNYKKTIMDKIISNEQTAYIKRRFIGINAKLVLDIYDYCMENYSEVLLLFLDFEKPFDSVGWNFLFKVLKNLILLMILQVGIKNRYN